MEPLDPPWRVSQPVRPQQHPAPNPLKSTQDPRPKTKSTTDPTPPQRDLPFKVSFACSDVQDGVVAMSEVEAATCTEDEPAAASIAAAPPPAAVAVAQEL